MKRSCINIYLKKDEILIKINEDSELKEIVESLRKKLPELKKFYKEEKNPIKVTGKILKNKEIDEIQNLIKSAKTTNKLGFTPAILNHIKRLDCK